MDITTATPAEIDAQIASLNAAIAKHRSNIERAKRTIEIERKTYYGSINQRRIDQAEALIETARTAIDGLFTQRAPFFAEYVRRDGWTRYFLVDSDTGNGHVHYDNSSYRCSRTSSTRHYWLTSESGKSAAEVIELAGEGVCTVCFPDAPVEARSRPRGYFTPTELDRQAKAAARETKRAAKAAKLITNPDGSVLRYGDPQERIETVVSAQRALVDVAFLATWYRSGLLDNRDLADMERIATALAHKLGTSPAAELVAADARYVAKCKREGIAP